jgi:hypothetical protein
LLLRVPPKAPGLVNEFFHQRGRCNLSPNTGTLSTLSPPWIKTKQELEH